MNNDMLILSSNKSLCDLVDVVKDKLEFLSITSVSTIPWLYLKFPVEPGTNILLKHINFKRSDCELKSLIRKFDEYKNKFSTVEELIASSYYKVKDSLFVENEDGYFTLFKKDYENEYEYVKQFMKIVSDKKYLEYNAYFIDYVFKK